MRPKCIFPLPNNFFFTGQDDKDAHKYNDTDKDKDLESDFVTS